MVTCYIGLGSNLGDRERNIKAALYLLGSSSRIKIEKASKLYATEPQGCPRGSPEFLNAVVKIKTKLNPKGLLNKLKAIEKSLGKRVTEKRFLPRRIDLDILFYNNKKINLPDLKIPHPYLRQRTFVLKPLKEIAPGVVKSLAKEIKLISNLSSMHKLILKEKSLNKTIGFVPTMGCLHQGHLSLIRQAKKDCGISVVSIFVNPAQFAGSEDYKKYPRGLEQDSILAKSAGCDYLFYPTPEDMYPQGYLTYVGVEKITDYLCGLSRPGHFRGVATVVTKLFNIIEPDIAYFGQKDYQQALVIKKMAEDLNMPVNIRVMPIVREPDGLAMSSRNTYLNSQERSDAAVLYSSLQKAKDAVLGQEKNSERIIAKIRSEIAKKRSARIDYIAIRDARTLGTPDYLKGKTLIALAVWIGKTRLIDNIIV